MIRNFVLESANAPGTNLNVLLAGPKPDRQSWRQAYADNAPVFYFIDDGSMAEWGVGTMHWGTPNTISRDTVIGNTAGTTGRQNFVGAVDIYNEIPGERMPYINGGVINAPNARLDPRSGGVPIAAAMEYYSATLPAGWLWANGAAVSRTTYAALFAWIGTAYGIGDGASTFNVPDRRESFSLGTAGMGGTSSNGRIQGIPNWNVLGAVVGDYRMQVHSHGLNWNENSGQGHTHGVTDNGHVHTYRYPNITPSGSGPLQAGPGYTLADVLLPTDNGAPQFVRIGIQNSLTGISASIANAGAGGANNIPPSLVCNVIIFAGYV